MAEMVKPAVDRPWLTSAARRAAAAILGLALLFVAGQHFMFEPVYPRGGAPNYDHPSRAYLRYSRPPKRLIGEPDLRFATRLNRYVHESTYHCEPGDLALSWIEHVVVLLPRRVFTEGMLLRERFTCGLCSQRAIILDEILRERGIKSAVRGLNGHVVAVVDGQILDPDFGVGPFSYAETDYARAKQIYGGLSYAAKIPAIVANRLDDEPIASNGLAYVERISRYQRMVLVLADVAAVAMALAGLMLLISASRASSSRRSLRADHVLAR